MDDLLDSVGSGGVGSPPDELGFQTYEETSWHRWILPAGAALLLCVAVWLLLKAVSGGPYEILGTGTGVKDLSQGAAVLLGAERLGEVTVVEWRDGRQVAVMGLNDALKGQLGPRTRFIVASTNDWWPGQFGVHIEPVAPGPGESPLASRAQVTLERRALGAYPRRFWFALLVLVGAVALTLWLYSILEKLTVILTGIALLATLVAWFSGQTTGL